MEKLRIEAQFKCTTVEVDKEENAKGRYSYDMKNLLQKFDTKETDISLYLITFERQAKRTNIEKSEWVSHLLGLLIADIIQLIAREPEEKSDEYDCVKELLLKRFSTEKFRMKFMQHQQNTSKFGVILYLS